MRVRIKSNGERIVLEDWTDQEQEAITKMLSEFLTPIVLQRLGQSDGLTQGGD